LTLVAFLGLSALNVLALVPVFLVDYFLDVLFKLFGVERGPDNWAFVVLLWAIPVIPGLLLVASWSMFFVGRRRAALILNAVTAVFLASVYWLAWSS
jgi:hypothetical protein